MLELTAERRGQRGYLAQVCSDIAQTSLCELQTVVVGIGRVHALQVLGIGLQEVGHTGLGHISQLTEDSAALFIGELRYALAGHTHL